MDWLGGKPPPWPGLADDDEVDDQAWIVEYELRCQEARLRLTAEFPDFTWVDERLDMDGAQATGVVRKWLDDAEPSGPTEWIGDVHPSGPTFTLAAQMAKADLRYDVTPPWSTYEWGRFLDDLHHQARPTRVERMRRKLLSRDDLHRIPKPKPLIEGFLDCNTLTRIYGPSGHGKSFLVLDMACCIGNGMDWHGQHVTQGVVIFVVAEGGSGILERVYAWEQHHGREATDVLFYPEPVQAMKDEWGDLIAVCEEIKPVMVVLDTQARITVGLEENSAKDVGEFIERCETLRRRTNACVVLIHHTGHEGGHARGSTAALGALNTELKVTRDESTVTLKSAKQKDRRELPDRKFTLETVYLKEDVDFFGETPSSTVLVDHEPDDDVVGDGETYGPADTRLFWAFGLRDGEASNAELLRLYRSRDGYGPRSEPTYYAAMKAAKERGHVVAAPGKGCWRLLNEGERRGL